MVIYIFSPSSCLYLPSGSQPGVMLLFYFIFLSREICGRAEMEMVLDALCLEICCFFKSLGPFRQLCLAFLIGRGPGECFIWNAMRQEKEPFWSLGKWLSTGCGLYHPLSPYLEPQQSEKGRLVRKRLMVLKLWQRWWYFKVTQKLQSQWTWRDGVSPGDTVCSVIRLVTIWVFLVLPRDLCTALGGISLKTDWAAWWNES